MVLITNIKGLNFLTTLRICCNLKNSQTLRENWSVRLQQNYF